MARPVWRSWRDDLLACRAWLGVHPFSAAALFLLRGGGHDRGRTAPRHGDGGRPPIRGQPRPERGGLRLLPDARLPVAAAAQGYLGPTTLSARDLERRGLSQ